MAIEKYEWMTILDWICDLHSELCERRVIRCRTN